MKKLSIVCIIFLVSGSILLHGCSQQDSNNLQNQVEIVIPENTGIAKTANIVASDDTDWKAQYMLIDKVKYHVLLNEYLDTNDKDNPDLCLLTRQYWCFDGTLNPGQTYPVTEKTALVKSDNIKTPVDFKMQLKNPTPPAKGLKLMKNTIISDTVLKLWNEQGYDPEQEYSADAPKNLTLNTLKQSVQ